MLNFGRDKKNKYSNSCVVRKINSERNKKPYRRYAPVYIYIYLYMVLAIRNLLKART